MRSSLSFLLLLFMGLSFALNPMQASAEEIRVTTVTHCSGGGSCVRTQTVYRLTMHGWVVVSTTTTVFRQDQEPPLE